MPSLPIPDNKSLPDPASKGRKGNRRPKAVPVAPDAGEQVEIEKVRQSKNAVDAQGEAAQSLRPPLTVRRTLSQEIFIDYLDVSYDYDCASDIKKALNLQFIVHPAKYVNNQFYTEGLEIAPGIVLFTGLKFGVMGSNPDARRVEIKGEGMQWLNHRDDGLALNHFEIMKRLYLLQPINVPRIDDTTDIIGATGFMERIRTHIRKNTVVTKARGEDCFNDWGNTLTGKRWIQRIGYPTSKTRMTFYDKKHQMKAVKNVEMVEECLRIEHTMKDGHGLKFLRDCVEAGLDRWHEIALGRIYNYVDFKDHRSVRKYKHLKHAQTAKWWRDIVQGVNKVKHVGNVSDYFNPRSFVKRTVCDLGRRLIMLEKSLGSDEALKKIRSHGESKLSVGDLDKIKEVKDILSKTDVNFQTIEQKRLSDQMYHIVNADELKILFSLSGDERENYANNIMTIRELEGKVLPFSDNMDMFDVKGRVNIYTDAPDEDGELYKTVQQHRKDFANRDKQAAYIKWLQDQCKDNQL